MFTVWYELDPYIKQTLFIFKGLRTFYGINILDIYVSSQSGFAAKENLIYCFLFLFSWPHLPFPPLLLLQLYHMHVMSVYWSLFVWQPGFLFVKKSSNLHTTPFFNLSCQHRCMQAKNPSCDIVSISGP